MLRIFHRSRTARPHVIRIFPPVFHFLNICFLTIIVIRFVRESLRDSCFFDIAFDW